MLRIRLLDTDVIMCAINPKDQDHERGLYYLAMLAEKANYYLPSEVLLEADLELKAYGYTYKEEQITFEELAVKIPARKILPVTPAILAVAIEYQAKGISYFDSLIITRAKLSNAIVVTRDEVIASYVETTW